jgi:ABC-type transport system involved in multi-copper enzyme maturation permease subunit
LLLIVSVLFAWGTYEVTTEYVEGPNGLAYGFMILLGFGLLMLSVTAPTALAEERMRGSLDLLLVTPLSTRSIVAAKWWGTYRRVLILAMVLLYAEVFLAASFPDIPIWATSIRFSAHIGTLVPLSDSDRIIAVTAGVADFLASGALIVVIGLILATWVPRLGQAVALSVIVFFLIVIGWPLLVEGMFSTFLVAQSTEEIDRYRWLRECLMSVSPLNGPFRPITLLRQVERSGRGPIWLGVGVAILFKAALTGLILWLTIKTFDRCLGRVSESRLPERIRDKRPEQALH